MYFFSCNSKYTVSFLSEINIDLEQSFWSKPNMTECKLLEELPSNIVDLHSITVTEGKPPDTSMIQRTAVNWLYLSNVCVGQQKN